MQLAHIDFERLSISPLNMRHGKKAPDVSDRRRRYRGHRHGKGSCLGSNWRVSGRGV